MKIVIDIPDEPTVGYVIEAVFDGIKVEKCRGMVTIVTPYENLALWNITWFGPYTPKGTVLPKGHGRLIDANNLMEYCLNQKSKTIDCNDIARFGTIIPSYKEESE